MTDLEWLIAVCGAAAGTYILRAAPLLWQPLREFGRRYIDFLTYVSLAIAAGIVSKALLLQGDRLPLDAETYLKFAGVLIALGLYRWIPNVPLALFTGAGCAVVLRWWFGG